MADAPADPDAGAAAKPDPVDAAPVQQDDGAAAAPAAPTGGGGAPVAAKMTAAPAAADPVADTSAETTTLKANSGLDFDQACTGGPSPEYPSRLKYGQQMQFSLDQVSTR